MVSGNANDEEVDKGNIFITNFVPRNKNINENLSDEKKDNLTLEEEKKVQKSNDPDPISFFQLYRYATVTDKVMIFIGCLGAIATGLCTPANIFIFGRLTNAMINQGAHLISLGGNNLTEIELEEFQNEMKTFFLDEINFFAIYNTLIGVIMLICSYLSIMLFNYAAHNQIYNIRANFLKSALNQDMSWYDLNQSGEFSSRMNEDLSKLEEGLGEKVVMFVHFMVGFAGSMILAFVLGWKLALVCLSSLPVTMISLGIVSMITSKLAKQELESYAKAGSIAEEVFSAIRTVFAFGGQEKESKRYQENLVDAKKINIKKGFFSGFGFGLLWFFIYASYALAFWYGVGLVLDQRGWDSNEIVYTPGIMFTVFFSVMMGSMNLGVASPFIEVFSVAKGAGAKVYKIIEQKPKIDTLADIGIIPKTAAADITFSNVYFEYPSRIEVKVLQGLNLTIEKGRTVALVGASGCGKSSCMYLIQRFYDPSHGSVMLDGIDIKTMNINWLRSKIGVVGQEPVLFGTTIYENIRYGYEDATKEQIEIAAKAANAHNFIKKLPNGYETLVGEKGAQMSGGQKQRIAIARALVRNPEILLLDEATSALDTASESKVQAALEKASKGRTTIIVAHRLTTIRNADKIFVINDGKIVEEGSHNELMLLKNHYHGLVTTQVGSLEERDKLDEKNDTIEQTIDEDEKDFIDIIKEDEVDDSKTVQTQMSVFQIIKWNKTEWPYITIGSLTSVIMGSAMPLFALLFGEILGVLSYPDPVKVRDEADIYSLYFVITGIVVGIATFLQIYTYGIAGEILTERVRAMTFSAMLKQEIGWFDDKTNGTGTLCSRLSGDSAAVQGATGQRIGTVLQSISTIILSIGMAFYYEWHLAFVALAFTPFLLVASYLEIRTMEQQNLGNAKAMEKSTKLAVEVISNIRTVVGLGKEKMFHTKYMAHLEPSLKSAKKTTHYRAIVYGIARSLWYFAYSVCMLYGGYLVVNNGVLYSDVFIVTQALIMGSVSIANALAFAPNFQKGLTAASKINQLIKRKPKVQDPKYIEGNDKKWDAYGNVIYYETEFFYPSRPTALVLNKLNINIMQGQKISLVGYSGCGKSTCVNLLERFYDTTSGYVAIDNKDVESVTLKNLRAQLGIVSQEPSLFDRTISENISYGDNFREISQNEIIEAAKNANIHTFITSLPLGYDTRLGDKGTQLSGGQKQRIAIARALIRNPRILLLDEATSALDSESEKVVQEALDKAKEGRTCITIAHRLTTIIDSDVIFVINDGKAVENGTHKELMELKGMYYGLYTLQSGTR